MLLWEGSLSDIKFITNVYNYFIPMFINNIATTGMDQETTRDEALFLDWSLFFYILYPAALDRWESQYLGMARKFSCRWEVGWVGGGGGGGVNMTQDK